MAALLVELCVEELPPKALKTLGAAFARLLADGLVARGLAAPQAAMSSYASPRRLAMLLQDVAPRAADRAVQIKLMPASVALDGEGRATPALLKKLAALGADGVPVADLRRAPDGKSSTLFLDRTVQGVTLAQGLQAALDEAIAGLPIPKLMQYQLADGWTSVSFVRPAHRLVALHGDELVAVTALGLAAGRITHGHRFEAAAAQIELRHAQAYAEQLLEEGAVIASFAERREELVRQLGAAAAREGLKAIEDDALLDEVTALVERPNVLLCQFEPEFLAVPQECLILTMKANQKYFPLLDAGGRLTHKFLVVSNITPADPGRVIQGNERVVRPRLADARFFFDQDRRSSLESRLPDLARVVYHTKLGSQGERLERVRALARAIGQQLGGSELAAQADRGALLAKSDLLTGMVGEFPELQGVMGGYYARHDGEADAVAQAIEDHYKPRFAGDALPRGDVGVVLALADKLEILAGLFGIGQVPTGDKDPYALRRHALGVIRLLIECRLGLAVPALVDAAFGAFGSGHPDARGELRSFLDDRLVGYLRELGYGAHEVDAVLALQPEHWSDLPQRLAAVRTFAAWPEAQALAAANKRVGNILKKLGLTEAGTIDEALLHEQAERALYAELLAVGPRAAAQFAAGNFELSLQALATLRGPVDRFFDAVMVNVEDPALRGNRLNLLLRLRSTMNRVADLARLAA